MCKINIKSGEFYEPIILEFESNVKNYKILRQLMYNCNRDMYIMYNTLKPIEKYTGETDWDFDPR
jgi:hypothetical protein